MRLTKSLLTVGCLMLSLTGNQALAEIYKITKADGSVVFTDQPAYNPDNKIEIIDTPTPPTNNNRSNTARTPASSALTDGSVEEQNVKRYQQTAPRVTKQNKTDSEEAAVNYQVEILTPSKERAYRKPAQTIDVVVDVRPSLSNGERVIIAIDGEDVASGMSANIPTVELLPGAHTLTATVISRRGATLASTTRTFHIIQNTMAMQNKRKLTQQLNAYYQLPWYKRLILQMSGNKPSAENIKNNAPKVSTAFR